MLLNMLAVTQSNDGYQRMCNFVFACYKKISCTSATSLFLDDVKKQEPDLRQQNKEINKNIKEQLEGLEPVNMRSGVPPLYHLSYSCIFSIKQKLLLTLMHGERFSHDTITKQPCVTRSHPANQLKLTD